MKVLWTFLFVIFVCSISFGQNYMLRDGDAMTINPYGYLLEADNAVWNPPNPELIDRKLINGKLELTFSERFSYSHLPYETWKEVYCVKDGRIILEKRLEKARKTRMIKKVIEEIYYEWEAK